MKVCDNEFWTWVEAHINDDPIKLRLKYGASGEASVYDAAIRQIECRKRFGKKLSETLGKAPRFFFPTALSGEQSTSDLLADYHAGLVRNCEPMIDLTAGLGIDVLHCSRVSSSARAIERSETLVDALKYNAAQLDCGIIHVIHGDCREYVEMTDLTYGTAFIDPARRSDDGGRVFSLNECEPDVIAMLPKLAKICSRLVVKMSPMLDISHTVAALGGCNRIVALGTSTECKELIAIKDFAIDEPTVIEATTLLSDSQVSLTFTQTEEIEAPLPVYSLPSSGDYFYEPYPAVMKSGANKILTSRFSLDAFHPNGRYYHSSFRVENFPGDTFVVETVIDFSSKYLKRFSRTYPVINVSARNFGMSAEALRAKLGVKEGGLKRVIGITDRNNIRRLIVISPLNH